MGIKNMDKTATHPSGLTVEFNDENHTYIVKQTGQRLTSVTTFIGAFFPKFDTDTVAAKCVGKPKYKGLSADEIKQAWADESLRGRTEGTHVHFYAECLLNGNFKDIPAPQSDREKLLFQQALLAVMRLEERFAFVGTEVIVFSPRLGIAGMIDLLMFDTRDAFDLIILDWKQNKEISTSNKYESAFSPIEHLSACDYHKYALQLNLYEKIIREEGYYKFPGFAGVRKALVHLKPDAHPIIKIETGGYQRDLDTMIESVPF